MARPPQTAEDRVAERSRHLWATYGITVEQWYQQFQHQHGVCMYCHQRGDPLEGPKPMVPDHEHDPPFRFRGLAHGGCNQKAGIYEQAWKNPPAYQEGGVELQVSSDRIAALVRTYEMNNTRKERQASIKAKRDRRAPGERTTYQAATHAGAGRQLVEVTPDPDPEPEPVPGGYPARLGGVLAEIRQINEGPTPRRNSTREARLEKLTDEAMQLLGATAYYERSAVQSALNFDGDPIEPLARARQRHQEREAAEAERQRIYRERMDAATAAGFVAERWETQHDLTDRVERWDRAGRPRNTLPYAARPEPMTNKQRDYLARLADQLGEQRDDGLSKAAASVRIQEWEQRLEDRRHPVKAGWRRLVGA